MFYDIPVYHYDTHVVYISPDNNSDKEFEEQIFMGIKSRKIVCNTLWSTNTLYKIQKR